MKSILNYQSLLISMYTFITQTLEPYLQYLLGKFTLSQGNWHGLDRPGRFLRMSLQYLKNLGKYMYSQKYNSCWFTVLCVPQILGAGEQGHHIYFNIYV